MDPALVELLLRRKKTSAFHQGVVDGCRICKKDTKLFSPTFDLYLTDGKAKILQFTILAISFSLLKIQFKNAHGTLLPSPEVQVLRKKQVNSLLITDFTQFSHNVFLFANNKLFRWKQIEMYVSIPAMSVEEQLACSSENRLISNITYMRRRQLKRVNNKDRIHRRVTKNLTDIYKGYKKNIDEEKFVIRNFLHDIKAVALQVLRDNHSRESILEAIGEEDFILHDVKKNLKLKKIVNGLLL
jgi:hypothetical protein